jgi:two-component system OmpR family response regulator
MDRETEHGSSPRILVVDDEPSITDLVSTVLRYEGFHVETAPTGRKALKAALPIIRDLASQTV